MNKQNILLLHGALGSASELSSLKEKLEDQFNVFSLDFSGHGKNTSDQSFEMSVFSNDIALFMKEHNLEKTIIFGYSMGGYAALKFAQSHPEKVEKIITLGTKFNWSPEVAEAETKKLNPEKIEGKVPAFAQSLEKAHGKNWKDVVAKTAEMMHGLGNGKAFEMKDLAETRIETLLLLAENDSMVSREETMVVLHTLPKADFIIIPDSKHPFETVDKSKLVKIIQEFTLN